MVKLSFKFGGGGGDWERAGAFQRLQLPFGRSELFAPLLAMLFRPAIYRSVTCWEFKLCRRVRDADFLSI